MAIRGLTLTDGLGYVSGDVGASAGGAIRVSGESLTLDGVRVARSNAGGSGGGIAFSGLAGFTTGSQTGATLTIRDSVFFRNFTVEFTTFQMGNGGGIYLRNAALVTIENTTLDANGGWLGDGGLWAEAMDATMSLQIRGSRFVNNTSVTNTASVTTSTIDQDGTDDNGSVTFTIAPAGVAAVPALDPIMLFLLAASLAVAAMLAVRYR